LENQYLGAPNFGELRKKNSWVSKLRRGNLEHQETFFFRPSQVHGQKKKKFSTPNFGIEVWSTESFLLSWSKARPRAWEGQEQFALEFLLLILKSSAMSLGGPKALKKF
jgi:hypothetical protein